MKLAIIGGGWAGLSAAVTALQLGHDVVLHESANTLGGRARSVHAPALEATVDNGQHILLGAYAATHELMRTLGLDPEQQFHRLPLNVLSADASLRLQAASLLPAPLNIAVALLTARGLSPREKQAALRAMLALRRRGWKTPEGWTVQQWLDASGQPPRLQRLLWAPLCIATLNTPVATACARLFARVLRDSLGASQRGASDMLIPRMGLTELWPGCVEQWANRYTVPHVGRESAPRFVCRQPHTVRHLRYATRETLAVDDAPDAYDAIVVCANTPSTARLLATLPPRPGTAEFIAELDAFEHTPIATLTLELQEPWRLPAPMLLLHEDRARGHFGQWLFQGQDAGERLLHIVVSDADALLEWPRPQAVASMLEQLKEQVRGAAMPAVTRHALIAEKRATFRAVPGLKRPGNRTPWPRVWVAGDWTDTGYPAVLEGAVRSGRDAVRLLDAWSRSHT